jgi:hypothetical protein
MCLTGNPQYSREASSLTGRVSTDYAVNYGLLFPRMMPHGEGNLALFLALICASMLQEHAEGGGREEIEGS